MIRSYVYTNLVIVHARCRNHAFIPKERMVKSIHTRPDHKMDKSEPIKILMVGPVLTRHGGVSNFIKNIVEISYSEMRCIINIYENGKTKRDEPILKTLLRDMSRLLRYPISKDFLISDVIHIHTASYLSFYKNFFYVIFSKVFKKKVILHIHGAEFHLFYIRSKLLGHIIIKNTLCLPHIIVVTSPIWISRIKNILNSDKKIVAIPNGYDPVRFCSIPKGNARNQLNIPDDKKVLVTIGHLENYKGHKDLIAATYIASRKRSDIIVYIIGEGPLRGELQKQIDSYNINVVLAGGNKPDSEIPLWINAADIFVLPSLAEGNPTVMFEALGCGKPFIGTRVGGIPDVIVDDRLGILVEPGNPEALAQAILQALEREWDHEYIREYAQQFTWENIARQMMEMYEKVLGR